MAEYCPSESANDSQGSAGVVHGICAVWSAVCWEVWLGGKDLQYVSEHVRVLPDDVSERL